MASYNFISHISKLITKLFSRRMTVCWDSGVPASRRQNVPTYKESRIKHTQDKDRVRSESFGRNRSFLQGILPHFAVRSLSQPGLEADDLIFGCCQADRGRVVIVSGDMDLAQLVSSRVRLDRPGKGIIDERTIHSVILDTSYDIRPRKGQDVVLFKALRGDPSDSIPPLVKPRHVCQFWDVLTREGLEPTIPVAKTICERLGIDLPAQFEKHYTCVDLLRSGVAADAISAAIQSLQAPTRLDENVILQKLLDVGIQPGYVHRLLPAFHYLA